MSIVETKEIIKIYQQGNVEVQALRGVSLSVAKGDFVALAGPSGSGKTTMLNLIGGLDHPTSGTVNIDGQEISRLDNKKLAALRTKKIGFVFQFFNLLQSLTARENIETALMLAGVPEKEQSKRAKELLDIVGLEDKADAKPGQLSGGQQQRVAIARALANNPPVLLMDEPTGNLDSEAEAEVMKVIKELQRQGKTIIFVTHSTEIASKADNLVYVRDGQIEFPEEMKKAS